MTPTANFEDKCHEWTRLVAAAIGLGQGLSEHAEPDDTGAV